MLFPGKYLDKNVMHLDPASRLRQYVGFQHRYIAPPAAAAVQDYQAIADAYE